MELTPLRNVCRDNLKCLILAAVLNFWNSNLSSFFFSYSFVEVLTLGFSVQPKIKFRKEICIFIFFLSPLPPPTFFGVAHSCGLFVCCLLVEIFSSLPQCPPSQSPINSKPVLHSKGFLTKTNAVLPQLATTRGFDARKAPWWTTCQTKREAGTHVSGWEGIMISLLCYLNNPNQLITKTNSDLIKSQITLLPPWMNRVQKLALVSITRLLLCCVTNTLTWEVGFWEFCFL